MTIIQSIGDDATRLVIMFLPYSQLLNCMLSCQDFYHVIDTPVTYKLLYQHANPTQHIEHSNTNWKEVYTQSLIGFSNTLKHNDIIVSNNNKSATNKSKDMFAKIMLRPKVIENHTLRVSVRLNTVGAGFTLLGVISSELLSSYVGEFNETNHYLGHYTMEKDIRELNIGYCDNGYMAQNGNGYHMERYRFNNNDIMSIEVNPSSTVYTTTKPTKARSHPAQQKCTEKKSAAGFVKFFRNDEQIGPTFTNVYIKDPDNPYHLMLMLNMMQDITIDIVEVKYTRTQE